MSTVPVKRIDRVQFYQNHVAPWTTNATAIGLIAAEVTDMQTKATAARTAYNNQQTAQETARAATETYYNAVNALSTTGQAMIKQIRARAEMTNDVNVYALAQIPAPATPSTRAAPGTPFDFKVTLQPNGNLEINWKCNNPSGTSGTTYNVFRRNLVTGEFAYLGGSGQRVFIDDTIPAGRTQLTYQIQAVRSTAVGVFGEFNVNFGTNASGSSTAMLIETPTRLAA